MSNLHTIKTITVKMRKYVTFIALLFLMLAVVSCENNSEKTDTTEKKPGFKTIFSKKTKENKTANLSDSIMVADTLQSQEMADSIAQNIDTTYGELLVPNDETDIDWANTAEEDSLDYAEMNDEDLVEEPGREFEEETEYDESVEEYVGYSSGDVILSKERILKTEVVKVRFPEVFDERDSVLAVIEERMSLNPDQFSKQIVVEKWYSPVNYRGYKFNRKKLMLYGMEKEAPVGVYFYLGEYYLSVHKRVYDLEESAKNKDFKVLRDSVLATYLLNY